MSKVELDSLYPNDLHPFIAFARQCDSWRVEVDDGLPCEMSFPGASATHDQRSVHISEFSSRRGFLNHHHRRHRLCQFTRGQFLTVTAK